MENLNQKAQEYKIKLDQLQAKKQDLEKQLIIAEEQYTQYKKTVEEAFQTTDIDQLKKIADNYLNDIQKLEDQLNVPT